MPFWFEEVLMGLGAFIWIVGELWAAAKDEDTTTSYVRRFAKDSVIARFATFIFVSWLWVHFMLGWF